MNLTLKKIAFSLALAALTLPAMAIDCVKVSGKTGDPVYFKFADKPVLSFTTENLVITTSNGNSVEYPLTDYRLFEFVDAPTAIDAATTSKSNTVFSFDSSVKGEGLQPGTTMAVYSINGQLVGQARVNANGTAEVSLDGLQGVYVVKTTTKSFKFIKK